jgi:hypothetical protein
MINIFYVATEIMVMLTSLYAAIYGVIYRNRFAEMRFLFIYPAASFTETFMSPIHAYFPHWQKIGTPEMFVNVFLLIEFTVLYHYYLQIIHQKKIRALLRIAGLAYISIMILIWLIENTFNKSPEIFFVPQAVLILPPSFYYFLETLKKPFITDIKSEPNFWIMIGIMLYFGCTLPLFLLDSIFNFYKFSSRDVYTINCFCYVLLYLLMIKAFLCKKREVL